MKQGNKISFMVFRFQDELIEIDAEVLAEPTYEALFQHLRDQAASGEGVL